MCSELGNRNCFPQCKKICCTRFQQGRRDMRDNSFLRDFRTRTSSSIPALRADDLWVQNCDNQRELVQDSGPRPKYKMLLSLMREDMLHKILTERREIGDSSFLARMLFSRRTMSRSMILRITSNGSGSPAEPEIFSTGEKTIKKV